MKNIRKIWIIFSVIFLLLCVMHIWLSTSRLPYIDASGIPEFGIKMGPIDISDPLKQFIKIFNESYIASFNMANKTQNLIAAFGYFVAFLTSIVTVYQINKEKKQSRSIQNKLNR